MVIINTMNFNKKQKILNKMIRFVVRLQKEQMKMLTVSSTLHRKHEKRADRNISKRNDDNFKMALIIAFFFIICFQLFFAF